MLSTSRGGFWSERLAVAAGCSGAGAGALTLEAAAEAVSTKTAGQCATTLIWTTLGKEQDPALKVAADQVRSWMYLMSTKEYTKDPEAVSRAWWKAKAKYYTADNPWATIKGPMGATIGTLDHCGR